MVKKKKSEITNCFKESICVSLLLLLLLTESEGLTPWEQYLLEKKERRKAAKQKRLQGGEKAPDEGSAQGEGKLTENQGFDDPFFDHSVTTATVVSGCGLGFDSIWRSRLFEALLRIVHQEVSVDYGRLLADELYRYRQPWMMSCASS